jgi:hydroxymethylpyrimidine/phosphomethylpyrimidine kinase
MDEQASGTPGRKLTLYPRAFALTIGGSDSSGGAGIQADLKSFQQLGAYGMSVLTLITAQNTRGVQGVHHLPVDFILQQLDAVVSDIPPVAAKTGALGTTPIIRAIAKRARDFSFPLVVDPVMVSKHGHALMDDAAIEVFREEMVPHATLLTPNRFEAEKLLGEVIDRNYNDSVGQAVADLIAMGAENVLLKLGEIDGEAVLIFSDGQQMYEFRTSWLPSQNTHGTGCVLSAVIVAGLAIGKELYDAIDQAIKSVWQGIHAGQEVGSGHRPIEFQAIRPFTGA